MTLWSTMPVQPPTNKPMLDVTEEKFDRSSPSNVEIVLPFVRLCVRKAAATSSISAPLPARTPRPDLVNASKGAVNLLSKSNGRRARAGSHPWSTRSPAPVEPGFLRDLHGRGYVPEKACSLIVATGSAVVACQHRAISPISLAVPVARTRAEMGHRVACSRSRRTLYLMLRKRYRIVEWERGCRCNRARSVAVSGEAGQGSEKRERRRNPLGFGGRDPLTLASGSCARTVGGPGLLASCRCSAPGLVFEALFRRHDQNVILGAFDGAVGEREIDAAAPAVERCRLKMRPRPKVTRRVLIRFNRRRRKAAVAGS